MRAVDAKRACISVFCISYIFILFEINSLFSAVRQTKITKGSILASLGEKKLRKRDGQIDPELTLL